MTQSILSNIFAGIARGAFDEARRYTRTLDRPFAGSSAARPAEDPYVLEHYGEMQVQLRAAECLLDVAGQALQCAWQRQEALTSAERVIMEGAGHACNMERPWEWDNHFLRFLAKHGLFEGHVSEPEGLLAHA